ncbi:MAG TPA: hypothetical protein VMS88_02875 [Terriglobales bacterium]|nr:hypothetical protein [Terriglobales bacterium]
MLERRSHRLAALVLALLMVLTTVAIAADVPTSPGATPDFSGGKFFAYLGCAVCVYSAVNSGGATVLLAVAVCGAAFCDYPN